MMEQELRIYDVAELEVRADDGGPNYITGYAAVFNARSHDLGGFVEEIAPGAFSRTLGSAPDVRATVDHRGGLTTIGRTRNNTLQLSEDANGLHVRIEPPETQAGRDVLTLVERRDITQMSFMFRVPKGGDEWERLSDGTNLRRLLDIELNDGDVSLVTFPAYPQTSAEARDRANQLNQAERTADEAEGGDDADAMDGERKPEARREIARRRLALRQIMIIGDDDEQD